MKSVRLDAEIEERLELAARNQGVSQSEFIREAVRVRADSVLGLSLALRLADVVGTIRTKGGRARRSGEYFGRALRKEQKTRRS